ncbi:MAG: transposase [Elusimicrobiota bacterium]|nr:MAG: transposase [Elusimicrobiota bacterium]
MNDQDIFIDSADRIRFLEEMRRIATACGVDIIAYCLMGNHFHFAIKVANVPLSEFMRRMLNRYASYFNLRHKRMGHLFQSRYLAYLCHDDVYYSNLIRYIHMNPIRAGIVAHPSEWPWSSFHPGVDSAEEPDGFDPWPKGTSEVEVEMFRRQEEQPDLEAIAARVVDAAHDHQNSLKSRSRARGLVKLRRLFVADAVRFGHSQTSIAKWLGTSESSVSRYAAAIMQERKN